MTGATEDSNGVLLTLQIPRPNNHRHRTPSLRWKIIRGTHSMLGGLCLIGGSCMYFAVVIQHFSMAFTVGGWLFTVGSFFLLLADLQQWWYDRAGCCFADKKDREVDQPCNDRRLSRWKRTETGVHSFITACGSACYVVGSALLIPVFERYAFIGSCLIMIGSTIIFLSACWTIYRNGYRNTTDPYDSHFRLVNIFRDIPALCTALCAGLGGVYYFLGVFFAPPDYTTNVFQTNMSAGLFVSGGSFFLLASFFLQFRYYCTDR